MASLATEQGGPMNHQLYGYIVGYLELMNTVEKVLADKNVYNIHTFLWWYFDITMVTIYRCKTFTPQIQGIHKLLLALYGYVALLGIASYH